MQSNPVISRSPDHIDPDQLLGYLAFQHIEEIRIHKQDLGDLFDRNNLSRTFLPHEIKPHDAFRRATATAARTIEINGTNGLQKARLLVREVKTDDKKVIRHLVREIVDSTNEVLDYATVGKMELDRNTALVSPSWDSSYVSEYAYPTLLYSVADLYRDWMEYHTKETVRNIVNRVIDSMNPVSIQKGGSATFIPKNSAEVLTNLRDMIRELPGNTSFLEMLPLVDTIDTRDLIGRRAEESIRLEIEELTNNFNSILQNGGHVTSNQVKRYASKFVVLQERIKEYEVLVRQGMRNIGQMVYASLDLLQEAEAAQETDSPESLLED